MVSDSKVKDELILYLNNKIIETNFIGKHFITIKYISNKSFTAKDKINKFVPISDVRSLEIAQGKCKHFKNLIYCRTYNKSNVNRIIDRKFRMLIFHENRESEHYHSHIISEAIPNINNQHDLDLLLTNIQIQHKGIENGKNGINGKDYINKHISYCCKTTTKNYIPLDIQNSDLILL